jgi:dienelactone hydrolase
MGYEAASADDAWRRIRAFFDEHLAAGEPPTAATR